MMVMRKGKKSLEDNVEPVDMVDGKWAYRRDPWSPVRVVSVTGNPFFPVISIGEDMVLREHTALGVVRLYGGGGRKRRAFDLVHCYLWSGAK